VELTSDSLRYLMVVLGALLVLMALHNILDRLIPQRWIEGKSIWKKLLTGGTVYMERNMKKAAAYKINDMIRNSMAVHRAAGKSALVCFMCDVLKS